MSTTAFRADSEVLRSDSSGPLADALPFRAVLLTEYDGTDFVGFQLQENGRSVQAVLESALSEIYKVPIRVIGCSRTDSGVHALGHVSHADVPFFLPPAKLPLAMNAILPRDVSVRWAAYVDKEFHARFSSRGKRYRYRIWNSPCRSALHARMTAYVPGPLDISAMQAAASHLVGRHDFSAFCSAGAPPAINPVRTLHAVQVIRPGGGSEIEIVVEGESFLYNMVRIIAGTLVYVGQGKISPDDLPAILQSADRRRAGKTMPPEGLVLERVFYEPDPFFPSEADDGEYPFRLSEADAGEIR